MEWERLGSKLKYYGVDPLINEINKLEKKYPHDTFLAAFIEDIGCTGKADDLTSHFFSKTSAFYDINNGFDFVKENFNSGQEVVFTNTKLSVAQLIEKLNLNSLDFLKIDVDGDDYPILNGFLNLEAAFVNKLLAFEIESQFHGDGGEYGNSFANILKSANSHGFYLYKLDSYTYSRNSLRKPYVYSFPAQTYGGQVLCGDALFIRDGLQIKDADLIRKLIIIHDIYGLEDCAFELIENHANLLNLTHNAVLDIKKNITSTVYTFDDPMYTKFVSRFRNLFFKMKRILSSFFRW
jgi:hypothetical protein